MSTSTSATSRRSLRRSERTGRPSELTKRVAKERQDTPAIFLRERIDRADVPAAWRDPELLRLAGGVEEAPRAIDCRGRIVIVRRVDQEQRTRRDACDDVYRARSGHVGPHDRVHRHDPKRRKRDAP